MATCYIMCTVMQIQRMQNCEKSVEDAKRSVLLEQVITTYYKIWKRRRTIFSN